MHGLKLVSLAGLFLATALFLAPSVVLASDPRAIHDSLESRYAHAHSLGNSYQFDARDGWQSVNITNLQYKYSRGDNIDEDEDDPDEEGAHGTLGKRASKKATTKSKAKTSSKSKPKKKTTSNSKATSATSKVSKVTSSIQKIIDTLKGVGKAEPVTITWYTGHDLENPSCWSDSVWAPTVRPRSVGTPQVLI